LWETARDLARECFESHDVPGAGAAEPPSFTVKGSRWQARQLTRQIHLLWELAYGPTPVRVSPRRLAQLQAEAEQVSAALGAGVLTFDRTGHS
jgi:hypothetical protein